MFGLWASYLLFVAFWQIGARAQAVCRPGFEWTFNSLGKSPCELGADVATPCTGRPNSMVINPLVNGTFFTGMTEGLANPCTCSTVKYVLTAACVLCQGFNPESSDNVIAGIVPFQSYTSRCSGTNQGFPRDLPPGLAIPAYAYVPIGINDRINVAALRAANAPDSTYIPPSTPTTNTPGNTPANTPTNTVTDHLVVTVTTDGNTRTSTSTSTTASGEPGAGLLPTSPSSTTTSPASQTQPANADDNVVLGSVKDKVNVAPIAGGIVGALIGGMVIAFLAVCLYRRRKKSHTHATQPRTILPDIEGRYPMMSETSSPPYSPSYSYTPQPGYRGHSEGVSGMAGGMHMHGSLAGGSHQMQSDDASLRVDPFIHSADPSTVDGMSDVMSQRTVTTSHPTESDSGYYPRDIKAEPPAYTPDPRASQLLTPSSRLAPAHSLNPPRPGYI